jgi:hypothetical protein
MRPLRKDPRPRRKGVTFHAIKENRLARQAAIMRAKNLSGQYTNARRRVIRDRTGKDPITDDMIDLIRERKRTGREIGLKELRQAGMWEKLA